MFGSIGPQELFLILGIALIVFGPRKLPEIGKSMGKMMAEFRKASSDFKRTIEEEVEAEKRGTALPPPASAPEPAAELTVTPAAEAIPQSAEPEGEVVSDEAAPAVEEAAPEEAAPVADESVPPSDESTPTSEATPELEPEGTPRS